MLYNHMHLMMIGDRCSLSQHKLLNRLTSQFLDSNTHSNSNSRVKDEKEVKVTTASHRGDFILGPCGRQATEEKEINPQKPQHSAQVVAATSTSLPFKTPDQQPLQMQRLQYPLPTC